MLHLSLSMDAKCPRHPNRRYDVLRGNCSVCLALYEAASSAGEVERHLRFAGRLGAEIRRKDRRRHSPPSGQSARPASSAEPGSPSQGNVVPPSAAVGS